MTIRCKRCLTGKGTHTWTSGCVARKGAVPENTSKTPPLAHLVGMIGEGGVARYIEEQERDGQRQLAKSESLPSQLNGCTEEEVRAIGIDLGPIPKDIHKGDALFRPATLPDGWKIELTNHSMWSCIVDDRGFARASMFYKAAFYDRAAHLSLNVRIRMQQDYDARRRDGTTVYIVTVAMPGCAPNGERNAKTIHTHVDTSGLPTEWQQADAAQAATRAWLEENYPDYKSATAYWTTEF